METYELVKKKRVIPDLFWVGLTVMVVVGSFAIVNEAGNAKQALFKSKTTPATLQAENAEARNDWAKQCLRISGGTRTPDECINAAFRLYPEKEWVGIAKNNEVIYKEYKTN